MTLVTGPKLPIFTAGGQGDLYLSQGNAMLRLLQALLQLNVLDTTLSAPPGSPANGDTYIVAAAPTGLWAGQAQAVAYWTTNNPSYPLGHWEFFTPKKGWLAGSADDNFYRFDGSVWVAFGFGTTFTVLPAWWLLFDGSSYAPTSAQGSYGTGTANQLKYTYIRVPYAITLRYATTRVNATVAAKVAACGIYDTSGNRLAAWDNISTAAGAAVTTDITGGVAVTLEPGIYIAACGHSDASTTAASLGGFATDGSNEGVMPWNTNGTKRTGTAANPMAGGAMPATLGALSVGGGIGTLPMILLEPAA